jgi:hypothetical protein
VEKPKVFVSHIAEETTLARILQSHIEKDFLGMIDVFVSSDRRSISVGAKWLHEIDAALQVAKIEIVLCSQDSVCRPWVNFEAGAGWVKGIPVIPVCHTGMRPVDLPVPLNMLQAIQATDKEGLVSLYARLAHELHSQAPVGNFDRIIDEIAEFEVNYGLIRHIANAINHILVDLPDLADMFKPNPPFYQAQGDVPDFVLGKLRPHLKLLKEHQIITFSTTSMSIVFTTEGGGNLINLKLRLESGYSAISDKVAPLLQA